MKVYSMSRPYEGRVSLDPINGNIMRVGPADMEFGPPIDCVLMDDGTIIEKTDKNIGLKVKTEHLPTKLLLSLDTDRDEEVTGIADVDIAAGCYVVSEKFREVVEDLEPNKHQFVPVDLIWKDGTKGPTYYWFFVVARIDSCDREKTTHHWNEEISRWQTREKSTFVYSLNKVHGNEIWVDKYWPTTHFQNPMVTENFKETLEKAGVSGVAFYECTAF